MAIRKIIKDDNPQLRKKSRDVDNFDAKLANYFDDLKDTLKQRGGVGLAAPQVSILRRFFIIWIEEENFYKECVNPIILKSYGEQIGPEGCLSVDNRQCDIKRPYRLDVKYYTRDGKEVYETLEGFHAVVFCHERDHLDGILFYDHVGE